MFKLLTSLPAVCAVFALATGVPAGAGEIYLASSDDTLYRVTEDRSIESWEFPDIGGLRAMHRDPATGEILVLADMLGPATVYILNNPVSGTPTLTEYAALSRLYGTMTQIGDSYYGFSYGDLYRVDLSDPANPVETYIGTTGVGGTGGAAYDPDSDTLYMASYQTEMLYTVDPATAAITPVGDMGISSAGLGAEWFDGGLFVAAQNLSTGNVEIGTLDVATGEYSLLFTLASGADSYATGLTVVPEPGIVAYLDIKPGSCPNPLNRNSHGVLPVAIVGTANFDVVQIDVDTLLLTRADGVGGSVPPLMGPPGPGICVEDVATPFDGEPCDCHELESDGIDDLSLKFDTQALVIELQLDDLPGGASVELVVSGELSDGTGFSAADCIALVPPRPQSGVAPAGLTAGDGGLGVSPDRREAMSPGSFPAGDAPQQDADSAELVRPSASEGDEADADQEEDSPRLLGEPLVGCGAFSPAFLVAAIAGMCLLRCRRP